MQWRNTKIEQKWRFSLLIFEKQKNIHILWNKELLPTCKLVSIYELSLDFINFSAPLCMVNLSVFKITFPTAHNDKKLSG